MIPYGHQTIDEDDIAAVVEVLRSGWLTTGPKVGEFERAVADFVGAKYAVAVSSGTAALHAAVFALGIGPGDEVIVPTMTFAATANCIVFQGGTPIFVDVNSDTLLIDPEKVEEQLARRLVRHSSLSEGGSLGEGGKIAKNGRKAKAIIAVDYAGQPCDYDALRQIADRHGLALVADACHSLGGTYKGRPVGSLADLTVFSFHPVKHITTGEGGMITTDSAKLAERMQMFRNHGITRNPSRFVSRERQDIDTPIHRDSHTSEFGHEFGAWYYEMQELGYNYRISDFQCALGLSQLRKLPAWVGRRREIARQYDAAFAEIPAVEPVATREEVSHAYHLYVVRLDCRLLGMTRDAVFAALRAAGIGVNVHYIPVHLHPFYRRHFATSRGTCPIAEKAHDQIMTLPLFDAMTDRDVLNVIQTLRHCVCADRAKRKLR